MPERIITSIRVDHDGNIVALCNENERWSPLKSKEVLYDLEKDLHGYHVDWGYGHSPITVTLGPMGKYLRVDRDCSSRNNLYDLPTKVVGQKKLSDIPKDIKETM